MTGEAPYAWVRQLEKALLDHEEIPLAGEAPAFAWEGLSEHLAHVLNNDHLQVSCRDWQWRSADKLLEGVGEKPALLSISLSPLEGLAYWVIDREALSGLTALGLGIGPNEVSFLEAPLRQGFHRYLAIQILHGISQLEFAHGLSMQLAGEPVSLPHEQCLAGDIQIIAGNKTFWGRLLVTSQLQKAWKSHFVPQPISPLSEQIRQTLQINLQAVVGCVDLSAEQWRELQPGDFILLDQCSLEPGKISGKLTLSVGEQPLFQGQLSDGKIKIVDYHKAAI